MADALKTSPVAWDKRRPVRQAMDPIVAGYDISALQLRFVTDALDNPHLCAKAMHPADHKTRPYRFVARSLCLRLRSPHAAQDFAGAGRGRAGAAMTGLDGDPAAALGQEVVNAIEAALSFDYLQHRNAVRDTLAGETRHYLEDRFIAQILVRRRVVADLKGRLDDGQPIILVGAPGGGKSAALIALNDALNKDARGWQMIRFNGNVNRSTLSSLHDFEDKKAFILRKLAQRIHDRLIRADESTEFEWKQFLAHEIWEFEGFRDIWGKPDVPTLQALLRDNERAQTEWLTALREFRHLAAGERLGPTLRFLRRRGVRLLVAIDNCDQLSNRDLAAARSAANDVHSRTHEALPVIVAVRPPSRRRVKQYMYSTAQELYLNAFESVSFQDTDQPDPTSFSPEHLRVDLQHAFDIFSKRLAIFEDPALLTLFQENIAERYGPTSGLTVQLPRSDIARIREIAQIVLFDYFTFSGDIPDLVGRAAASLPRLTVAGREDLTRVFIMWHNGSLRELGESFYAYMKQFEAVRKIKDRLKSSAVSSDPAAADLRSESEDEPIDVRSLYWTQPGGDPRTVMFRHVLFHATSREDVEDGLPNIHPSLRLFTPSPAANVADFTFPRARVLQYLAARTDEPKPIYLQDLRADFEHFGISEGELDTAILNLWERDGYATGLVRIDGIDKSPDYEDGNEDVERSRLQGDTQLEILPAGVVLITRLVYVVEYLYWSGVTDKDARKILTHNLNLRKRTFFQADFSNIARNRVMVATAYLHDVMLDRFLREHPYIEPDHDPTDEDAHRLRNFATTFGFGPGDWYINRALTQIHRYSADFDSDTERWVFRIDLPRETHDRLEILAAAAEQLDAVYYKPT